MNVIFRFCDRQTTQTSEQLLRFYLKKAVDMLVMPSKDLYGASETRQYKPEDESNDDADDFLLDFQFGDNVPVDLAVFYLHLKHRHELPFPFASDLETRVIAN
jgi:hypothetical protein